MLLNKFKKRFLIPMSLLVFIIGFLGIFNYYKDSVPSVYAKLNNNDPQLFGYAWTETFGWISFNCYDGGTCNETEGGVNYGVTVNPATGELYGYAWSEYAGWINFNEDTEVNKSANYNKDTREFSGWAKVEVLGEDGWIKLNHDSPRFYVSAKPESAGTDWGDLQGWAYNGNDTPKTGLGWISFNCSTDGSCGAADYKVTGKPTTPVIDGVVRTPGEESHSITVRWNTDVLGEETFYIIRDGEIVLDDNGDEMIESFNTASFADGSDSPATPKKVRLEMGEEYVYKIRACNIFACVDSASSTHKTSPILEIGDLAVNGICGENNIGYVLEWTKPIYLAGKEINYYEIEYCTADVDDDIGSCVGGWNSVDSGSCHNNCENSWQGDASEFCYSHLEDDAAEYPDDVNKPEKCNDAVVASSDKYNIRYYRVRGVHDKEEEEVGSWRYSKAARACMPPSQPQYEETKPE